MGLVSVEILRGQHGAKGVWLCVHGQDPPQHALVADFGV